MPFEKYTFRASALLLYGDADIAAPLRVRNWKFSQIMIYSAIIEIVLLKLHY